MLEKTNSVYIIGTLVEVKKQNSGSFQRNGVDVPYVSSTVVIKCILNDQENLIQVENFTSQLTKSGTVNKNYNTWLNINDLLNQRVVISGASLAGNRFWSPKNEQLVPAVRINANIIGKANSTQTVDKAEFKFGGFVKKELTEKTDSDGNTLYYEMTIAQANFNENNMFEVPFIVHKDNLKAIASIQKYYEVGATVVVNGMCSNVVTTNTTVEEVAFGEPQVKETIRSEKHYVILGGTNVIEDDSAYSIETIKALNSAYVTAGEEIKSKAVGDAKTASTPQSTKAAPSKKAALAGLL